ncbi:hypothetical protein [Streptomyces avicenniae]|uniref:hypothetical protein n=1 Tax=Streptomyces avicenniae TaxID=500153 RepID=UPI00069B7306|nr:hypothetical protein [Streptomyces avicenniae]
MLSTLTPDATTAAVLVAGTGLLYAIVLGVVALTSVLARTPARRRDARSTLTILVGRRRSG